MSSHDAIKDKKQKFRPNIKLDHLTKSSAFMTGEEVSTEVQAQGNHTSDMKLDMNQLQIDVDQNPFEDDNFKITQSGCFEYQKILKIGKDGIKPDANSPALHKAFSVTSIDTTPSSNGTTVLDEQFEEELPLCLVGGENLKFEDLEQQGKIGHGASANVRKVIHKKSKEKFAQKTILLGDKNEMKPKAIWAECRALYNCSHPNIVKLYEAFYRDGAIHMILEYMDCRSLADVLSITKTIPEYILAKIAAQILEGLNYIHERKIIHRDIKPQNILLNQRGVVKVADFGMAGIKDPTQTNKDLYETFQGTLTYMSPERLQGREHTYNSDIWSVGLVLIECATGKFPFELTNLSVWEMISHVLAKIELPQELSEDFRNFIQLCLTVQPENRPSAATLLKHDFIVKNLKNQESKPSFGRWLHDNFVIKVASNKTKTHA